MKKIMFNDDYALSNPMRKIGTIHDHLLNEK